VPPQQQPPPLQGGPPPGRHMRSQSPDSWRRTPPDQHQVGAKLLHQSCGSCCLLHLCKASIPGAASSCSSLRCILHGRKCHMCLQEHKS
jgi:hypothetical protein